MIGRVDASAVVWFVLGQGGSGLRWGAETAYPSMPWCRCSYLWRKQKTGRWTTGNGQHCNPSCHWPLNWNKVKSTKSRNVINVNKSTLTFSQMSCLYVWDEPLKIPLFSRCSVTKGVIFLKVYRLIIFSLTEVYLKIPPFFYQTDITESVFEFCIFRQLTYFNVFRITIQYLI